MGFFINFVLIKKENIPYNFVSLIKFDIFINSPEAIMKYTSVLVLAVASTQEEHVSEPLTSRFQFSNKKRR